jgi:hypothetical protein
LSKNKNRTDKFKAMEQELYDSSWRARRADYAYQFYPTALKDSTLSSRLHGPQFKTIQWDPSSRRKE